MEYKFYKPEMTTYFGGIIRFENGKAQTAVPYGMKIGVELWLPTILSREGMSFKEMAGMLAFKVYKEPGDFIFNEPITLN